MFMDLLCTLGSLDCQFMAAKTDAYVATDRVLNKVSDAFRGSKSSSSKKEEEKKEEEPKLSFEELLEGKPEDLEKAIQAIQKESAEFIAAKKKEHDALVAKLEEKRKAEAEAAKEESEEDVDIEAQIKEYRAKLEALEKQKAEADAKKAAQPEEKITVKIPKPTNDPVEFTRVDGNGNSVGGAKVVTAEDATAALEAARNNK